MGTENMPQNEPSGSHQLPSPPQTSHGGPFSIDARTLAMAALFLVGGTGAGAGTSLLGGSGVKEELVALRREVAELKISVERRTDSDEIYRRSIDDHEKRIRALERKVPD